MNYPRNPDGSYYTSGLYYVGAITIIIIVAFCYSILIWHAKSTAIHNPTELELLEQRVERLETKLQAHEKTVGH